MKGMRIIVLLSMLPLGACANMKLLNEQEETTGGFCTVEATMLPEKYFLAICTSDGRTVNKSQYTQRYDEVMPCYKREKKREKALKKGKKLPETELDKFCKNIGGKYQAEYEKEYKAKY